MMDRLKPATKSWHKRQRIHRHNGYSGHARMMEMQLQAMLNSDSTSEYAKYVANCMLRYIPELKAALKIRIDK